MEARFSKIHPELRQAASKAPSFDVSRNNLWLIRLATWLLPARRVLDGAIAENIGIPGQDERTKIRLRIYRPRSTISPTPVLVWLHGGGYVMGKPEMDDQICARYARELGIAVVSVDYRFAPKHPFPVGLNDSYAALQWVRSQARQLGVDTQRIAIGGASAGGGLAAALVQLAHDRGEISPVFQLLVYPMLDDRTVLRAGSDGHHVAWSRKSNRFGWESYLGMKPGAQDMPAYAAPARRAELSGLPPAWIGVGTEDLFHDEDVAYARRLMACNVDCELSTVPGAFHGFDMFAPQAPIVQKFRESQMAALKKHLFPFRAKASPP